MCMPVTHMSKYTYILRCFDLFWLVFLRTRTVWPKLNVFTGERRPDTVIEESVPCVARVVRSIFRREWIRRFPGSSM